MESSKANIQGNIDATNENLENISSKIIEIRDQIAGL
jgi:hypothetical protein